MTIDQGGQVWRWEVRGRQGELHTYGQVDLWGTPEQRRQLADRWAADKMAIMLFDAEPHYEQRAGWLVRLRSDDDVGYEAVSLADAWLEILRGGVLARMRDRVELLRPPARR